MEGNEFDDQVTGIAALQHPISRQAYRLVLDRGWVSRDTAADSLDVARSVAAFHLDKLVDAGLLDVRFERVSGRTGPGAGRPAKIYGRTDREIDVSLPPRRYDLAGAVLAEAVTRSSSEAIPVDRAVALVARETGERLGADAVSGRKSARRAALMEVLTRHGYEPRAQGREIALLNCPFHSLAGEHRNLVCGMNLELLTGVLDGIDRRWYSARLAPEPGRCCVRLSPR